MFRNSITIPTITDEGVFIYLQEAFALDYNENNGSVRVFKAPIVELLEKEIRFTQVEGFKDYYVNFSSYHNKSILINRDYCYETKEDLALGLFKLWKNNNKLMTVFEFDCLREKIDVL